MSDILAKNTKPKIVCIQMYSKLGCPEENEEHAQELIGQTAAEQQPDIIILPENFKNLGKLKENLADHCYKDGDGIKRRIGALAKKYNVNIVAGSEADMHNGKIYNTAFIFDRSGECIATYDKTHLVYPSEFKHHPEGDSLCTFMLDGIKCGIVICNDLKFPEPIRKLALEGIEILFVPSAWPDSTLFRLEPLRLARAIENQIFVVNCNACAPGLGKVNAGNSVIIDPSGRVIASAGATEEIIMAECDLHLIENARRGGQSIFERIRPELY